MTTTMDTICGRCGLEGDLAFAHAARPMGETICPTCHREMDLISNARYRDLTPYFIDPDRPVNCQPAEAAALNPDADPTDWLNVHHHRCVCKDTGDPEACLPNCWCFFLWVVEGLDYPAFFDRGVYLGHDDVWGIGLSKGPLALHVGDRIGEEV